MDLDDEPDELSAAAIARLAGVTRAAVTGWRSRYPDFPKPVAGTTARPTFSRIAVVEWLTETGKASQLATAGYTDTGTHLTDEDERLRVLREQAPESGIADLIPAQLLARTMAALLPRTTAISMTDPADPEVSTTDATLVVADDELEDGIADLPVVVDPTCGDATLLTAVGDRFGGGVRLVGQDLLASTISQAVLNLRETADTVPYDLRIGDSLYEDQLVEYRGKAAAAVCDPPFSPAQWSWSELADDSRWVFGTPGPRDAELAWVQHCYAQLRPHGVAVVAVTARSCVQASGQAIRATLVRSGVLRDVIALPKDLGPTPDVEVCLWVLRRPYGSPDLGPVRMVDLSQLGDGTDIPYDFAAWQQLFDDADPAFLRPVSRLELLDGNANLLPSRYVSTRVAADASDFTEVTDRLQNAFENLGRALPRFAVPASSGRHSLVTFAELERVGALSIHTRDTTPRSGDLLMRVQGLPPAVAMGTPQDEVNLAYAVEIDESRLDAHFVAAFLRADANAQPMTNTLRMLSRDDLRRCRIPRMPLSEQRRFGNAFRRLDKLEQAVSALAATSAHVIDQIARALTTGVLDPDFSPPVTRASADEEMRNL